MRQTLEIVTLLYGLGLLVLIVRLGLIDIDILGFLGLKRRRKMSTEIIDCHFLIISPTGKAYGWGTDGYRWVSGLSKSEREGLKKGTATVVVTGCPGDINGRSGITWRVVKYSPKYGYTHRLPEPWVRAAMASR